MVTACQGPIGRRDEPILRPLSDWMDVPAMPHVDVHRAPVGCGVPERLRAGTTNTAHACACGRQANLVRDLLREAMPATELWGELTLESCS